MRIPTASSPKRIGSRAAWRLVLQLAGPLALGCAVLGAFALRVDSLAAQSLWFDEALSVVFATKQPTEQLALLVTEDIHPPLYQFLLSLWILFAGSTEYAVRFLSVISGVAVVPLFYVTGRRLALIAGDEQAARFSLQGLVGAILAASSAFYVGYSQETRNYMLVTFLGLLSSYLLLRAWPSPNKKPWVLYAVATVTAVYVNYTAFLLLPFHGVFVLLARRPQRRARRRWVISTLVALVSYLPWLGFAFDQLTRINDYWPGTLKLGTAVRSTFGQLLSGGGAETPALGPQLMMGVGLLLVGMAALAVGAYRARSSQHSLFLLLYFILPSVTLFSIAYTRPKFDPRYLLVATPAFYLILAWGISSLLGAAKSRLPVLLRLVLPAFGVLALAGIVAVSTVYGEPAKVKADYRSLVSYIHANAQPGDAVVFLMSAPHPYIYYSTGNLAWYPMERVDDFGGAITRLNNLMEGHRRLWFVLWQTEWEDPADYVIHILEDQSTEVKLQAKFTGLGLRLFELSPNRPFSYYPPMVQGIEANFGGSLDFWGWMSSGTRLVKDDFRTEAVAGEKMRVDVHWIPQKRPSVDLKTTITLVGSDGHAWARVDEVMGNGFFPPTKWKPQEIIHDRHQMEIPAGTPPGDYELRLIVYDPVTLKPLDIKNASGMALGASLTLGKVTVRVPSSLPAPSRTPAVFTWQLGRDVLEASRFEVGTDVAAPGDSVEVTVRWRVPRQLMADYDARIVLLDSKSRQVAEQTVPLSSAYPASTWRGGEEVLAKYWVQLPVDLDQARYWIEIGPVERGRQPGGPSRLAQAAHVDVETPDAKYDLPKMQHALGAHVGSFADLAGYDVSATQVKPGGNVVLTIYWKDVSRFDRSYKVFTHVIDDSNVFAGQRDAIPVGDTRPTTTWRRGEVLVDRYEIPISPDAKPGSYNLKVGMYAQDGGQRLPIVSSEGTALGDSVTLARVEVRP